MTASSTFYDDPDEAAMDGDAKLGGVMGLIYLTPCLNLNQFVAGGRFNSVEVPESDSVKVSFKGPRGSWGEGCRSNAFNDSAFRQHPIVIFFFRGLTLNLLK